MKSCSYGTTCRTPATTTYSRGPGGEPRRPAASPSALVSRDIAETATNTPVGESVPQGAGASATEEKGGGGIGAVGRIVMGWRAAHHTWCPADVRPTDQLQGGHSFPPTMIDLSNPQPGPIAVASPRASIVWISINHKGTSHAARAPADARATLAAARPPLSFSLVIFRRVFAPRRAPPRTRRETVAPRAPRARPGTPPPSGHARARSHLIGAGRHPRVVA